MIDIVPLENVLSEIEAGESITVIYPSLAKKGVFFKKKIDKPKTNSFSYQEQTTVQNWLKYKMERGDEMLYIKYS